MNNLELYYLAQALYTINKERSNKPKKRKQRS